MKNNSLNFYAWTLSFLDPHTSAHLDRVLQNSHVSEIPTPLLGNTG